MEDASSRRADPQRRIITFDRSIQIGHREYGSNRWAPGSIEHKGHTRLKYGQSKQKEGLGTFFNVKCEKRDRDDHSSCVDVDPD